MQWKFQLSWRKRQRNNFGLILTISEFSFQMKILEIHCEIEEHQFVGVPTQ